MHNDKPARRKSAKRSKKRKRKRPPSSPVADVAPVRATRKQARRARLQRLAAVTKKTAEEMATAIALLSKTAATLQSLVTVSSSRRPYLELIKRRNLMKRCGVIPREDDSEADNGDDE